MNLKVNKLSTSQFNSLLKLCENVKKAEQEHLLFLHKKAPGLTFYEKHGKGNMVLTPLSIKQNKDLVNFLTSITNKNKEDIVSIHFTEYNVGSQTTDHIDSNSSSTYLFLLNPSEKGGDLRVNNKIINFKDKGNWVVYNGGKLLHGVTPIEEGFRKVLVIWYGDSINKKTIL